MKGITVVAAMGGHVGSGGSIHRERGTHRLVKSILQNALQKVITRPQEGGVPEAAMVLKEVPVEEEEAVVGLEEPCGNMCVRKCLGCVGLLTCTTALWLQLSGSVAKTVSSYASESDLFSKSSWQTSSFAAVLQLF